MPAVLVNRPEPGASRTAEALGRRGIAAVVAPLFHVTYTQSPAPDGPFDALIVSSANGADGLEPSATPLAPDAMVFAVGERTAAALAQAGFRDVRSADGDQRDLARLVIAALPASRKLLYATAEEHKPGLPAALTRAGHTVALWVRYRAEAAAALPEAARDGLKGGAISHVLHYSRRGAETFVTLAEAAGVADAARRCTHLCLSPDTAEPLRAAGYGREGNGAVLVAAEPEETSLLDRLSDNLADSLADNLSDPAPDPAVAPLATAAATSSAPAEPVAMTGSRETPDPPSRRSAGLAPASTTEQQRPSQAGEERGHGGRAGGALAGMGAGLVAGLIAAGLALWQGPAVMEALGLRSAAPDPVAPLAARVSALEAARAGAAAPITAAQLNAAMRNAATEAARAVEPLRGELRQVQGEVARLAARPGAAGQAAGVATLPEEARTRLEAMQRAQDELVARVQALEPRLREIERAATGPAARGRSEAAARIVLAERIVRALDEGRAFAAEVRALEALGAPAEAVRRLGGGDSGEVPSRAALSAAFREVRPKLLVETAGSPEPSLTERLLRLTDGLIRVRATGSIEGVSPAALSARIDQSLQRGDVSAAQAAFAQLPEPARREGATFETLLTRRAQAETAVRSILDDAVKALAAP